MEESSLWKVKKGYLNEDFRFFHLKDRSSEEHSFHYHDFNKIVIFISGNVTYVIEGKHYKLKPWDILFVGSNELHKPIIAANEYYERIILWINSDFLQEHYSEDGDLLSCFEAARKERQNLLRLSSDNLKLIKELLFSLEKAIKEGDFGGKVLQNAIFMQLIVYLNRLAIQSKSKKLEGDIQYDERIVSIIAYINENLDKDLSIESIAKTFYLNRYYLMHNFKAHTGYTLHGYILQKRLTKAAMLIEKGMQTTYAADNCGFGDYSSFVRAFKKCFGLSPKQYYKAMGEMRHTYAENDSENINYE
jgi:AraC-like DNA-binding protein